MKNKLISLTLVVILLTAFFGFTSDKVFANFRLGYPSEDIEVRPPGLAKGKQTIKVKLKGHAQPRPKTVWTQTDTEIWKATSSKYGTVTTNTFGSGEGAFPLKLTDTTVKDEIDTRNYVPESLTDKKQNPFISKYVQDIVIDDIKYNTGTGSNQTYGIFPGAKPNFRKGSFLVTIETMTGTDRISSGGSTDYKYADMNKDGG
ncbi:hypothetical protein HUB98_15675 [Paenibacillus barcinonensis]|uniref:Uncharacterized protein n=1 Tax=Paenibacillus barcinonensis TaxID=198119 RepID=A0A2V4UZD7_PAEBA|nr:hypothetical protein [Paenibacillus barcinonensis]PYE41846.1 hypothetical protein DFQ00_1562 [Paenibacillus barcinonensis]QKS57601.1 hypothetical protein HUB98_15675 [Paenibacillus barcinonensis]